MGTNCLNFQMSQRKENHFVMNNWCLHWQGKRHQVWKHCLLLPKVHPKWKAFCLICPSHFSKFLLSEVRQHWQSSPGQGGHPLLSRKHQRFVCLTMGRLIFLSYGETLDFPGGSVCFERFHLQNSPHTKQFFCFLCCPYMRGSKGFDSLGWGRALAACSWVGSQPIIIKHQ